MQEKIQPGITPHTAMGAPSFSIRSRKRLGAGDFEASRLGAHF
jgi:hypothetical protein